jgi:hypothetical protein
MGLGWFDKLTTNGSAGGKHGYELSSTPAARLQQLVS